MWTDEQRKAASVRAKTRWANPDFKKMVSAARSKQPKCPSCGETDINKFYVDAKGRRTNKYCQDCHKKACKKRWHNRSQLDRWASRNYKYGVTKEFLIDLYKQQDGKCKICGDKPVSKRGLHIDHDHKTGLFRGILCHGCNTGIGALKENPEIFIKAIRYLRG